MPDAPGSPAPTAPRDRPWLVFDGDCAFCTTSDTWVAERLHRASGADALLVPWQFTDLDALVVRAASSSKPASPTTPLSRPWSRAIATVSPPPRAKRAARPPCPPSAASPP